MENQEKFTILNLTLEECEVKHLCPVCGKECSLHSSSTKKKLKWRMFCSDECRYSELGLKIVNLKLEKTNMERYGVKSTLSEKNTKEKIKQTCLEKYGVEYAISSKFTREKSKQTCLEKYGVENPFQVEEYKEKSKQTCLEKYGVEHSSQSETVKNKMKETLLKHYGVENASQSEEIKNKVRETNLKKFGCEYRPQTEEYKISVRLKNYDRIIKKFEKLNLIPLFDKEYYILARRNDSLKFKCGLCGNEFEYIIGNGVCPEQIHCPNPEHKFSSSYEREIYDWLKALGIKNIETRKNYWGKNNKKYEADIYLPDYKLAIEFNGIYWHSNKVKNNNYHFNKWKFFKDLNNDCIQIFENDWLVKKDVIKSIIKRRLNICEYTLNLCKYDIKDVEESEYKDFILNNSLKEYELCKRHIIGLYHNNELVCCLSLTKSKYKKYNWNVDNYVIKNEYNVFNGFNFLLVYFRSLYQGSIVFYVDNRYYNIDEYEKAGFKLLRHTKPNFYLFFTKSLSIVSIFHYKLTENKIKKVLPVYDDNLSIKKNIDNNKYFWFCDCGNDILTI